MPFNNSIVSQEMIDYQKPDFFHQLTEVFRMWLAHLNNHGSDAKDPERTKTQQLLSDMCFKRFGLRFNVVLDLTTPPQILFPLLDTKNVLFHDRHWLANTIFHDKKYENNLAYRIAAGQVESPIWSMNRKAAKVTSKFWEKEPAGTIYLGDRFLLTCTAEENAAVFIHEIGHGWTFLEVIGQQTVFNQMVANNIQEVLNAKDEETRYQVLAAAENIWGIKIDKEQTVKLDAQNTVTILTGAIVSKFKEEAQSIQYNLNSAEQLADQFAVRMGGGAYIGSALNIKKLGIDSESFLNKSAGYLSIISVLGGALAATGIGGPLGLIIGGLTSSMVLFKLLGDEVYTRNKNGWSYDNMRDRFNRVYREMIGELKQDVKRTPQERQYLIAQIEQAKQAVNATPEYDPIVTKIVRFLSSNFRQQEREKFIQQITEELLNNNLFLQVTKLQQLTK